MILSSRCGRGRFARSDQKGGASFRQDLSHFRFLLFEMLRCFRNRLQLDQNVFPREFGVRIGARRDVAVGLDAVMIVENVRRRSERRIDLLLAPDIEGALALSAVAGVADPRLQTALSASSAEKNPPSFAVMSRRT